MTTEVSKVSGGSSSLDKADVLRLARLENQIERAVKAASEPIGVALRAIRDDKLYRATHASFERYVVERWGFSKATAYRMMDTEKLVGISPPETASSQVSASQGETIRTKPSTNGLPPQEEPSDGPAATPPAVDRIPDRPARPPVTRRPSASPTGPSGDGPTAPEGTSGGGTPADVLSDADGLRWMNSRTPQQWRAVGDPYGPGIRAAVRTMGEAFGIRSPGRVIPPGERDAKADAIGGKADPATCKHPKQSRQVLGYMVKCGLCDTKVA